MKFYTDILKIPLLEYDSNYFTLQAGHTELKFEATDQPTFYHFALFVKTQSYRELVQSIRQMKRSLIDDEGNDEFDEPHWHTKQFYFEDPQGNNVELLSFDGENERDWVRMQEIGLPVLSVPETVNQLRDILTDSFSADVNELDVFRFVGNHQGVLVIVRKGRNWFPTNIGAVISPITIQVKDGCHGLILKRDEEDDFEIKHYNLND